MLVSYGHVHNDYFVIANYTDEYWNIEIKEPKVQGSMAVTEYLLTTHYYCSI